jgi:hypothetical protein
MVCRSGAGRLYGQSHSDGLCVMGNTAPPLIQYLVVLYVTSFLVEIG